VKRISIKGALVGGVLDVVLSGLVGIPLVIFVLATSNLLQTPRAQLSGAITAYIHARPGLHLTELVLGAACTVLGGYISAVIAKHDESLNGLLASLVCVGVGVFSVVTGRQHGGAIELAGLFGLTLACGALGGYLRARQLRGRSARTPAK
jgi:hypothetical protein